MRASRRRPAYICNRDLVSAERQANLGKRVLVFLTYATASAIIAFAMSYWPVSAGNILTKLNVVPNHLTSASEGSNFLVKGDRAPSVSFEQRWSAVPRTAIEMRGDKSRRQAPQAEGRIEKVPFSCELAFSRLVRKGNFSTRCVASVEHFRRVAAA